MLSNRVLSGLTRLEDVGEVTAVGVVLEQDTGAGNRILRVPEGQCFLLEALVVQADITPAGIAAAFAASPDATTYGIGIADSAGSVQNTIEFRTFHRWQNTFQYILSPTTSTPFEGVYEEVPYSWHNAPPGNVVTWRPTYPFPVPETWQVQNLVGGEWGNQCAVYGRMVSMDAARTLGYQVSSSSTDANRRHQATSISPTGSAVEYVAGRTDKCIRILDIHVRIQPKTNTTNKVTLRQTDDRVIFSWTNNNPSDLFELKFSPDIFLQPGQGIESLATVAGNASIVIVYEYVDSDDVPADHWWAYVEPDLPTPEVPKVGLGSNAPAISTVITCFYPKRSTTATPITKTSPTQGFQHIIRGYTFSAQKDSTARPDQTAMCLSNGASAGNIQFTALGVTSQANVQLSPTITITAHDMCVFGALDRINIPCKKDDGSIWVDTMAVGVASGLLGAAATPISTDADVDEWSWTVWGSTIPARKTDPSNRGE